MRPNKVFPFHTLLFAIYPVVVFYKGGLEWIPLEHLITPFLVMLVFTGALFFLSLAALKDLLKAGLYVSFFILLFFSHTELYNKLSNHGQRFRVHYMLATELSLYIGVFWLLYVQRGKLTKFTKLVNAVAFCLLSFNAVNIGIGLNTKTPDPVTDVSSFSSSGEKPDVYFFLLDMYARADVLQRVHNYNNGPFLNGLRQRGFYVADSSHSNYPYTLPTLASMLNFQHLDKPDGVTMRQMIQTNKVIGIFQKLGYYIVAFRNGCSFATLRNVDRQLTPSPFFNDVNFALMGATPLQVLPLNDLFVAPTQRESILQPLEFVKKTAGENSPRLVYMHVICPHPPYVFGANGEAIPQDEDYWNLEATMRPERASQGYVNQLQYLNKLVSSAIDTILAKQKKPFVIVLMGDHGTQLVHSKVKFEGNDIGEHMSNLFAVSFSDRNYESLYQKVTPVNVFPLILNKYFEANIPLQPDRNYFYVKKDVKPRFVDVTDVIRKQEFDYRRIRLAKVAQP